MTLHRYAIAVLFALSLVTLTLALTGAGQAEDARRTFVATRLAVGGSTPDFGLAPEIWSRSLHDLVALLDRVREDGFRHVPQARPRSVTLAEAMGLQERRRELIEALELTVD